VLVWGGQERADGPILAPPFAAWRPTDQPAED
jgi:hypothetical protein